MAGFADFNLQAAVSLGHESDSQMTTLEQRYDRWERIARRCYEAAVRESRESRQQTKKLKLYLDAQTEWYAALHAVEELPANPERKETLLRARQVLDQAREELRRSFHFS